METKGGSLDLEELGVLLMDSDTKIDALKRLNRLVSEKLGSETDFGDWHSQLSQGFDKSNQAATLASYTICLVVSGRWELGQIDRQRQNDIKPFQQFAHYFNDEIFTKIGRHIKSLIADAVHHPDNPAIATGIHLLSGALCAGVPIESIIINKYNDYFTQLLEMIPQKAKKACREFQLFFNDICDRPKLSLLNNVGLDPSILGRLDSLFENVEDAKKFSQKINAKFMPC